MDQFTKYNELQEMNRRASEIIKQKGLNFLEFYNSTNLYEYNIAISHSFDFRKLLPDEYRILRYIVKQEYKES